MNRGTIIRYALLVFLVVILGAITGWYFFLRSQTGATQSVDTARGFSTGGSAAPFGNTGSGNAGAGSSTAGQSGTKPAQLWHIATAPAAGIGFATTTALVRLRFVDRATGYVFEANPEIASTARLTNTLMPKTYEALFSEDAVIERSVDETGAITTFAGTIHAGTSTSLTGTTLPKNIGAISIDPKLGGVVYLARTGSGVSVVSAAWDGTKTKTLYASPLADWRVWALQDGRTIIAQKAADGLPGYAYVVKNNTLDALTPSLPGLTILPRSGSGAIIYGMSSGAGPVLFVQLSASSSATRLPIATVADKCLWAPGAQPIAYCAVPQVKPTGGFLDAWYRGEIHTSDAWWKVDASTGQAQLIFTPASNEALDVIKPVMDPGGAYIAFINNVDLSPWLLRLNL